MKNFAPKTKEMKKYLLELEENLFKPNRYYDYDDIEYKGISTVKNLYDLPINTDYYKPIITNGAFNKNYIQYESKENKDKKLTPSEYLDMIRPYLGDIINDRKTQGEWRIYSRDATIKYQTQSEWKTRLTITINFISSKPDSNEILRT